MTQNNDLNRPEDKILEDIYSMEQDLADMESERGFSQRCMALLKTRFRHYYVIAFLVQAAVLGLAIWCAYQFFSGETVKDLVFWGICMTLSCLIAMGTELWFWMEMNRNGTLREIKRLELQIALLRNKSKGPLE